MRLVNVGAALLKFTHEAGVAVCSDDVMPHGGEACARHQTDPSAANDRDSQEGPRELWHRFYD